MKIRLDRTGLVVFTLLFTNDFHNHLNVAQAEYLRRMRSALGGNGMLLDAGDAVGSGNMTFLPGGEPILGVMNDIGYDAMTVGNREFHITQTGFRSKVGLARFPMLCANIQMQGKGGEAGMPTQPYYVHNLQPSPDAVFRILVLGLTVPMVTARMLARKVSAYIFDDPLAVAAALVPRLRDEYKPDVFVALTHIGIAQDRNLAVSVPGIDLIVGGHTHVVLEHGEQAGTCLIAQAGSHGRFLGRVDIVPPADPGSRLLLTASLSPLPKSPTEAFIVQQLQSLPV